MTRGFSSDLVEPPLSNLSVMIECLIHLHDLSQFPDCLVAGYLAVPLDTSRLLLAVISRR